VEAVGNDLCDKGWVSEIWEKVRKGKKTGEGEWLKEFLGERGELEDLSDPLSEERRKKKRFGSSNRGFAIRS